jgi:nucleoside-triphosphatase THEP1
MSGDADAMRVQVKRSSKKKVVYEIEKRDDGHYYFVSVPSKKSSIKPGDRLVEVNGVKESDFKSVKKATTLFDTLVIDVVPIDDEESEDEESEEEAGED